MTVYKKTVRTGKFAKAGEDFRDGDMLVVLNEGVQTEGTFGVQDIFKVRVPSGEELSLSFNKTSLNNLIDAFGDDSKAWIGQSVRVWRIRQNVQGKMVLVTYVSHPDATIDEESGDFMLPVRPQSPVPSTVADMHDASGEIDPSEIPF